MTAVAADSDGHTVTQTSTFRTLAPAQTFRTQIFEGYHQTYGVGMPIMLTFSEPVTNKAAVEQSLQIRTSQAGGRRLVLGRRPDAVLPAAELLARAHHGELRRAPGRRRRPRRASSGTHTLTQTFTIGRSLIVVASTRRTT